MTSKARAGASVSGRTRCGREISCEAPDDISWHAGDRSGVFGREPRRGTAPDVGTYSLLAQRVVVGQSLAEDDVQHREQQPWIGVRPDEDMLVGLRSLGES